MKSSILAASSLLTLVLAAPAFAQPTTTTADRDAWRMPHQRGFWGHAGLSFGRSELDMSCAPGLACDTRDKLWRAYAGGRFNNAVGLELGLVNIGKFTVNGGDVDGWGADVALVAGFPIGTNSAIFGKLGVIYGRTEVDVPRGKERGFGPRFGIGGQVGLTPNWALRADLDRYHMAFPGGKDNVDALTVGVQYTFR